MSSTRTGQAAGTMLLAQPVLPHSKRKQGSTDDYFFSRVQPIFPFLLAPKKEKTCFEAGGEEKVGTSGQGNSAGTLAFIFLNSIETFQLSTRCISFQDANKFQAITFA